MIKVDFFPNKNNSNIFPGLMTIADVTDKAPKDRVNNCLAIEMANTSVAESQIRSHITDSVFFGEGYCTKESRSVFGDLTRMQRWLDVEVALADSQAELGIIPKMAAKNLANTAKIELLDLEKIKREIAKTKHSLIPLLLAWQCITDKNSGQYIHYGATTQDIQDTAQVLEIRDVISIVERDLKKIITILAGLAKEYRDLVIVGRTHGQDALPTTLGLKIAGWLDESMRNFDRLQACKKNVLVSQLFGGVGTMAALSEKAIPLLKRFSERLQLEVPCVAWHSSRDRFVELLTVFALITGAFGKIANEVIQLNKNGIAELSEPFQNGQIGSSTMPHKRNPEICERIVTLSRLVKSNASLSFDSLCSEHERDYRSVRLEWITITDASLYTCCALDLMKSVLSGLNVHEDNIRKNVEKSSDFLSSEAVMFFLGNKIGKQVAHKIVYEAAMKTSNNNSHFIDELFKFPQISKNISKNRIKEIMKPSNNIGLAGALVDNIVVESKNKFDFHPDKSALSKETDIVLHYIDPIENFNGWLVIDDAKYVLSAGGMRVQKGLSVERLKDMARNMTKKMRICGLPISGAKAGIDYDPNGAGKNDAICRFMGAIKPFLARRYSMGSDLNTTMDELNQVARKHQIRSIKIAIEVAQKYEPKYFDERISILNKPAIGDWTLGNIRGGYGVAMAAMRVIGHLGISHNDAVIAVQGFGVLAKASIVGLLNEGVKIKAVADIEKCIVARPGKWLPIEKWLKNKGTKLPDMVSNLDYEVLDKEKIYQVQCDVLMLEAIENAITEANVDSVNARSIVPGANLAVSDIAERTLYNRGVIVLPCFVAGSGGPMSMNGLFGHKDHPTTLQVLNYMKAKMGEIVDGVIKKGREESKPLTMAANELVFEMKMPIREYPYEV